MTNKWESYFWGLDQAPVEDTWDFIPWEQFPMICQQSKGSFFLMSHADANPMVANAPCYGRRTVKIASHVRPIGKLLWDSGDEIRIVSDTHLSRSWAQVQFRGLDCLNQRCWHFLCSLEYISFTPFIAEGKEKRHLLRNNKALSESSFLKANPFCLQTRENSGFCRNELSGAALLLLCLLYPLLPSFLFLPHLWELFKNDPFQ